MAHHWPRGPYLVHADTTDPCRKFWCLLWNDHDGYADCACGFSARTAGLDGASAAMSAHIAEQRAELEQRIAARTRRDGKDGGDA